MARIEGVSDRDAGLVARLAFWFSRRKFGRVLEPIRLHAQHPRLLRGLGHMEMAQQAASTLDASLKELLNIKVAMGVGCPF